MAWVERDLKDHLVSTPLLWPFLSLMNTWVGLEAEIRGAWGITRIFLKTFLLVGAATVSGYNCPLSGSLCNSEVR